MLTGVTFATDLAINRKNEGRDTFNCGWLDFLTGEANYF